MTKTPMTRRGLPPTKIDIWDVLALAGAIGFCVMAAVTIDQLIQMARALS